MYPDTGGCTSAMPGSPIGEDTSVITCTCASEALRQLILKGDLDFARALGEAAIDFQDKSTIVWQLARSFHVLSHRERSEFVSHTVRGFAKLPADEQAAIIRVVLPHLRQARQGRRGPSPKSRRTTVAESAAPEGVAAKSAAPGTAAERGQGQLFPLVGTTGRRAAHPSVVQLLDVLDASLRRVPEHQRKKLHQRLDKCVTQHMPPLILARLLQKLPEDLQDVFEDWIVEEGTLPRGAARRLVSWLLEMSDMLGDAQERVSVSAENMWEAVSSELGNSETLGNFWTDWVQGTSTSSATSTSSVVDERARMTTKRVTLYADVDKNPVVAGTVPLTQRRVTVRLHCPPESFLF